jgi:nucleoside-diphosphate-sugar epimerase
MPVEINGDGLQCVDLVHVHEIARVLVDALDGPWGVVLDAGTGVATTVLHAAEVVVALCRSASPITHLPMRDGEPEHAMVVALNPLCETFPFPYAMDETIDYYRWLLAKR